jgi:RNA polymerase sigma-70 factor (ECF subfamily)
LGRFTGERLEEPLISADFMSAETTDAAKRLRWERGVLERVRRGEATAFGELYRAYAATLYRQVLYPALGNRTAAEDALAETFRTALQRLGQFESNDVSIYFWLARIAKNKATDMHRAKNVTRRALANFERLLAPSEAVSTTPEGDLDQARGLHDMRQQVERALGQINERYAQALRLRFLEDRSREECATALEVKLGTFDVLLLRALRAFRKHWEEQLRGAVSS